MTDCPSDAQLAALLAGSVDLEDHEALEEHLSHCATCQNKLEDLAGPDSGAWQHRRQSTKPIEAEDLNAETCPVCGASRSSQDPRAEETTYSKESKDSNAGSATILAATVAAGAGARDRNTGREFPAVPGYQVESTLGRGGMGVVYRARQLALNRPVALKMIVSGRHATPQQLARFQLEAEALACLHHENVVRIYESGEHEAGPYLALELIEGRSLAEALTERTYSPREAAKLCLLLARAIQAAHASGVVHRDLKPANVLLTADGLPKVTDFGLAKRLSENSQWTKSDAVMGTPHYMAPEQAAGDVQAVGPLADVYSLGTILYELLAGHPPFPEQDLTRLFNQIRAEPPRSIRKLRPNVPKDLETICLRCLEKAPERRYESAAALADDLERFLGDRPILARPVGAAERLVKWVRRRPAIALLLVLVFCLGVVTSVGGVTYHLRLRNERDRAEQHFQLATAAVDGMLAEIGEEDLLFAPQMEQRREKLLKAALSFSKALASEKPEDSAMQRNLGFCYRRMGDIQRLLGDYQAAETDYHQAIQILGQLRQAAPDDPEVRQQLAAAYGFLGELQRQTARMSEAGDSYRAALVLYQELLQENAAQPDYLAEYARTLYNFGIALKDSGELDQARQSLSESARLLTSLTEKFPEERRYAQHLARSDVNLGSVLRQQGSLRKGRAAYQQAIEQLARLRKQFPHLAEYQCELALAHNNLGNLLAQEDQRAEAIKQHQLAETTFQNLINDHPAIPQYRRELANTYNSLGATVYQAGDVAGTRAAWKKSVKQFAELVARWPDVPDHHGDLGMIHGNLGQLELKENDPDAALKELQTALPELRTALRANPQHPDYRRAARGVCRNLAAAHLQMKHVDQVSNQAAELLANAEENPIDAWLAAVFVARVFAKHHDTATPANPVPLPEEFDKLAVQAARAFIKSPAGARALDTEEEFSPLRKFLKPR